MSISICIHGNSLLNPCGYCQEVINLRNKIEELKFELNYTKEELNRAKSRLNKLDIED